MNDYHCAELSDNDLEEYAAGASAGSAKGLTCGVACAACAACTAAGSKDSDPVPRARRR